MFIELGFVTLLVYFFHLIVFRQGELYMKPFYDNVDIAAGVLVTYLAFPYIVFLAGSFWYITLPLITILFIYLFKDNPCK